MTKKILFASLLLVLISSALQAQYSIQGTITDQQGNPSISAKIILVKHKAIIDSTVTDYDGNYHLKVHIVGRYSIRILTNTHAVNEITNIQVRDSKPVVVNTRLSNPGHVSKEVVVIASRPNVKPLIDFKAPGGRHAMSAERLEKMPSANAVDAASLGTQSYQQRNGQGLSIGGARTTGTQYIVDGVLVNAPPSQEGYAKTKENGFNTVTSNPLSTMSVDVDRASYSNVRRFLNNGQRPPVDAVRVEEMINYFNYTYPQPKNADPIAIFTELSVCPWNKKHQLLHVGLQARSIDTKRLPASNLVFLIDVSGSMMDINKLPLVKASMKLLVGNLREEDKVSIVVYAGNAGLVLQPTSGGNKESILAAIDRLEAGGSTAGGAGIQLAYSVAKEQFIAKGNNRIILATDGDFNVGVSSDQDLEKLIVEKRKDGIFLTCLGFGMGNYKDSKMETMADKGNGNYAYIDNIQEARKTLISEFGGTLFTVAKDVKAQIEFNPAVVKGYRLIGYENRLLKTEDFKDDKKDAAEMGSGHSVTILYEIIPAGSDEETSLKYQQVPVNTSTINDELATIKFRYKKPDGDVSKEINHVIANKAIELSDTSPAFRFSASVAIFGMLLHNSEYKEEAAYDDAIALAEGAKDNDEEGFRSEYIRLVKVAKN